MTSDLIIVALIAAVPPTIAAVASLLASRKNKEKIDVLHVRLNSRLDEMIEIVKKSSVAQGRQEQREVQEKKEAAIAEGVAKGKA